MKETDNDFYFRQVTEVKIPPSPNLIQPESKLFFIGSYFSQNLSRHFSEHFLNVTESGFGTLYNPISIAQSLERILATQRVLSKEFFEGFDGVYRHFDFSRHISHSDREKSVQRINLNIEKAKENLLKTDLLNITLGTAYAYRHKETNKVVASCHKVSANHFDREMISVEKGSEVLYNLFILLRRVIPSLQIVLTLSPIRYLEQDASENSHSKAILRCTIERLRELPFVEYFPASEIVLDELRDYRWFSDDMLHPSKKTTHYLFERFIQFKGDSRLKLYIKEVEKLRKIYSHIPLSERGKREHQFQWEKEINSLLPHYPHLKSFL